MEASKDAPQEKTTARKSTEAAKKVRAMVKMNAERAHRARAEGWPVAYLFIGSYYDELLRAMDVATVGTENWAGVCAAKRDAERFLARAEAEGYPRHLCTYATCGLGYEAMRREMGVVPDAPDGGMEMPTVMLGAGLNICDPRYKWYQAAQRYNDVPMHVHGLLWPPVDADLEEVEGYYIKYLIAELKGLVEFLERELGKKMDWDRLSEIVDLTEKTQRIWYEAYLLRKAIPTPMSIADALNTMVPGYFMMGTQEALGYYQDLYNELKERVDNGVGVIPDEKYRLLWGSGLPPWFGLMVFNYFESLGAVFPIETCYHPPPYPLDIPAGAKHPLERIAWRAFRLWTYWDKKAKARSGHRDVEWLLHLIEEYNIDGLLCHRAMTCRTLHAGQLHLLQVLRKYTDIPTLILESDIVDMSSYSEADTHAKVDAFIEIVDAYKKKKQA